MQRLTTLQSSATNGQRTKEYMARILYKYLPIDGAKCMIGNRTLQFTNASQLNDPFDCHPKLLDYANVPANKLQGWIPEEWWLRKEENDALNLRNNTWLCSLSKVCDSILMWSHHCYNHKGVCIGIDIDKVMDNVPPLFGSRFLKPFVLDVQYQDIVERPDAYRSEKGRFMYQWTAKAKAFMDGRDYVTGADVQAVFKDVCAHRVLMKENTDGKTAEDVLSELLKTVENPDRQGFLNGIHKK